MDIKRIAAVLDDDVDMLLEDLQDFFSGRDLFAIDPSPFGLTDDPLGEPGIVLQLQQ